MTKPHLTLSFTVDRSPADVFAAVSDVRRWWGAGIEGATAKVGDEFTYRHADLHLSRQKLVEVVPDQRLVWKVTDANLSFVRSPGEWKGTELRFDLVPVAAGTEVRFSHVGLGPECECYEECSKGWAYYVGESLRALLATGTGKPDAVEVYRRGA